MSQNLKLTNYSSNNIVGQTQLTAAVAANATSLPVVNSENFTTGFLLLGTIGANNAELLPVATATPGQTLTLTQACKLPHGEFEPVYALFGNEIKVYSALDAGMGQQPPDTSFNPVSGSPVAIDSNKALTDFTDPAGGATYWYKQTFFNSVSGSETSLAYTSAVRGNFTVNYCSLDEIRYEAGFRFAPYITDDAIDLQRQAAQDIVNGALDEFYETPLQPPINNYLRKIVIVMAAGLLRKVEFSSVSDTSTNGQEKIDWAEIELDKLVMKERVLTDGEGRALDKPGGTGAIEGWPNNSTSSSGSDQGGAPRVFRMSDIQGQGNYVDQSGNPVGNPYYGRRW